MKTVKWILQIVLALAFLGAGLMKLITPYDALTSQEGMGWTTDFSATAIKIIAALEVLGAIGVVLPQILNKYKFFVPLAAIGLMCVMIGAIITHVSRNEGFIPPVVLLVLAALVAFLRRDQFSSSSRVS